MTKRWWVVAEQYFPTRNYHNYGHALVVHRICFKRSEWSISGLRKNKFQVDIWKFDWWRKLLYRDDSFSRVMWPGYLKHQRKINDWLIIS